MKILAISDEVIELIYSPRIKERFADVDLILGCGDLPYYYLEFIVTLLDVPLYYVPGNHDKTFQFLSDGRIIQRAEGCEPLDGKAMTVSLPMNHAHPDPHPFTRYPPLLLAGLGGCLRYNADASHQYSQGAMSRRVWQMMPALLLNRARYGRMLDILVTHAPPRGIHDAEDLAHTGFDAFLPLMSWARPRYLLHGHSHVYRADVVTRTQYQDTTVLNVYPYRVIEF